ITAKTNVGQRYSSAGTILQPFVPGKNIKAFNARSQPITIAGDLPIHAEKSGPTLKITAPAMIFAEKPLPTIQTGAVVAEVSTTDLVVKGTVFQPEIAGTLYVRNSTFWVPQAAEEPGEVKAPTLKYPLLNVMI